MEELPASVVEVVWRLGELTDVDTLVDINAFDGKLLTQAFTKTGCNSFGVALSEKTFISSSKDYYILFAQNKACKDKVKIIKAVDDFTKGISQLPNPATVIFYCPSGEEEVDKHVKHYLTTSYENGIRILTTRPLIFLPEWLRELSCKTKEKDGDIKVYFYKNEADKLSKLQKFLDPMKNPLISTFFNGMLLVFLAFLVYLASQNLHSNHVIILIIMTLILQIGINWFLKQLRNVYDQLEDDLQAAAKVTEIS